MPAAELQPVMTDFYAWVVGLAQGVHRRAQPLMRKENSSPEPKA